MLATIKSRLERGKALRRVVRGKTHKPLHRTHHVLHLGYLASIVFESRDAHIAICAAMFVCIVLANCLGDEI